MKFVYFLLHQACGTTQIRRRRAAEIVPTNTTITSPPIFVGKQSVGASSKGGKNTTPIFVLYYIKLTCMYMGTCSVWVHLCVL